MEIISIGSLWMPILVSAVIVFLASWVLHAVLKYHHNDHVAAPDEDALMDALRPLNIPPGQYVAPKPASAKDVSSPAYRDKAAKGPAVMMTVLKPDALFKMGPGLAQWFLYSVIVAIICAYAAGRTLGAGAEYLAVFRIVGVVAFACYSVGEVPRSIWFGQKWSTTFKTMFDGLVYALVTAGAFGWLWPDA